MALVVRGFRVVFSEKYMESHNFLFRRFGRRQHTKSLIECATIGMSPLANPSLAGTKNLLAKKNKSPTKYLFK